MTDGQRFWPPRVVVETCFVSCWDLSRMLYLKNETRHFFWWQPKRIIPHWVATLATQKTNGPPRQVAIHWQLKMYYSDRNCRIDNRAEPIKVSLVFHWSGRERPTAVVSQFLGGCGMLSGFTRTSDLANSIAILYFTMAKGFLTYLGPHICFGCNCQNFNLVKIILSGSHPSKRSCVSLSRGYMRKKVNMSKKTQYTPHLWHGAGQKCCPLVIYIMSYIG